MEEYTELYKPSEEYGLIEDFSQEHDPQYLLEEEETEDTFQLDFGYFQYQTGISDW